MKAENERYAKLLKFQAGFCAVMGLMFVVSTVLEAREGSHVLAAFYGALALVNIGIAPFLLRESRR
jgi:hypothetical protein